jgi:hypothetical protein
MDVVERGNIYVKKVVKYWNTIDLISDHLNGRTKCRKVGPQGVLAK